MVSGPAPLADVSDDALCLRFVRELSVSGASISVSSNPARQSTVCVSDACSARIDALQFELGEGPRWDALTSRCPVLCPDVTGMDCTRWPIFLAAAQELGVGALFSFPMIMGAALVGVVDLYCADPRSVDQSFQSRASMLAGQVASAAVQKALHSAESHTSRETAMTPSMRREIHQATGMILSQLDVTATEAFSRLQGYAFAVGRSIDDIAHQVVKRTIRFDSILDSL